MVHPQQRRPRAPLTIALAAALLSSATIPAPAAASVARAPGSSSPATVADLTRPVGAVSLALPGPRRAGVSTASTTGTKHTADEPTDAELARDALRTSLSRERFYFVMTDRFANGDPSNDRGGLRGDRSTTGFDPTDKGFYQGGDLKGLLDRLDYIKGLGTTAIWLTPAFTNRPVQGTGTEASAGYHGYWITDFTRIDPHLGTNAQMKALVTAAHKRGMKVFFDIITNHTADLIDYAEQMYGYRAKAAHPYLDARGKVFDDRDHALGRTFPTVTARSFPYTPVVTATTKVPAWLNDPTM